MGIPKGITREHVEQAMQQLNEGIDHPFGESVPGVSQRVTSPRRTRARSYSAQFPTRYVVLYFGCTLDFTSRS